MSTRHAKRAVISASIVPVMSRLRNGLASIFLLASLCALPATAMAAGDPQATLTPTHPDSGSITAGPGQDTTLEAVKKIGGRGVENQEVDWSVTGPGQADLSVAKSMTSAQGPTSKAGFASTVFHANAPGNYVVTASTQKNPGCTMPSCATWVSTRFAVNVAAAGADGSSSSGASRGETIGVVAAIGAGIALAAANSNGNDHHEQSVMRTLANAGGNNQSAMVNSPLAQPLVVHAENNGASAASIAVQWSASGGAVLSSPLSFTDANGVASVRVVSVGPTPGTITITATRSDDSSATVSFTATVLQPPAPSLNIVSGNNQSGLAGQRASAPLVVEAELGSAPQANVPVAWAVTSGPATIVNVSNGGNTNGGGQSAATIQYGPTAGPVQVTATRTDDGLSQTFNLSSSIVNGLTIVSGDGQNACPNKPLPQRLVVTAQTNNRPTAGVTIDWTASSGASLASLTTVTLAAGQSGNRVTNIGPDYQAFPTTVNITATRSDDPSASVNFSANLPAVTLQQSGAGDGQSGSIGTNAPVPLDIQLDDGCGQPIAGQTITWTITGGSATFSPSGATSTTVTTTASGNAPVMITYGNTPGNISVQASALGGALAVPFNLTATTSNFAPVPGSSGQAGNPGQVLTLKVRVSPATGGVPVTFSVSGSSTGTGTILAPSTTTAANGIATTQLKLGTRPGSLIVIAQAGSSQTQLTETVNGMVLGTTLNLVSGNNQIIAPNAPSQHLVVVLQDSNGVALSGQTIDWNATNGAMVSANSTVTGPNGQTSVTVTPTTTGPISVTATFPQTGPYNQSNYSFSENTTISNIASPSSNDQAVGVALDSACASLQGLANRTQQQQDLLNQCLSLSASSTVSTAPAAQAIHQLTPTVSETQTSTATTATTTQFNNLAGRMQALRGGAHGASFAGLAFDNDSGSLGLGDIGSALLGATDASKKDDSQSSFSRWGFFGSGQIDRLDASQQNETPGYNFDSNGVTFGLDYRVNDGMVLGGAVGFTHQSTSLIDGEGDLTMHGWSLSGYSTWYRNSDWYIDSSVTWSDDSFESRRHIAYALPLPDGTTATVDQLAQASSGSDSLGGSVTFGRDFHAKALAYGFYGKLQYNHESFDSFTEQLNQSMPGSGLGLRVDSRTTSSLASVLGAKIDYNNSMKWGVLVPHAEIEWQHEFRTDPNTFTAFFADDPTDTPILIHGDRTDADYFRLGAGMTFVFPQGRSAFLLYDRTVGREGITEYNLSLGFRMEF